MSGYTTYIQGDALIDALLSIDPSMKGKVDRYGADPSGEVRFAITTYKYYGDVGDPKPIADCASKETDPAKYYACFNAKQEDEDDALGGKAKEPEPEGAAARQALAQFNPGHGAFSRMRAINFRRQGGCCAP